MTLFYKFMQVHENEEDQDVSSSKEAKCVLSLLHTRDTKYKKQQQNSTFSNRHYHIQHIKDVQNKYSTCLGIIGSFLGTQLLQKSSK